MGSRVSSASSLRELKPAKSSLDALAIGRHSPIAYQIAIALNRDMGIASELFPKLDGENDAQPGSELLDNEALELMRRYVSS